MAKDLITKYFKSFSENKEAFVKVTNHGVICYVSYEESGNGCGLSYESGELFEKLLKTALNFMCEHDPETLKSLLNEINGKDLLHYEFGQSILEQKKKEEKTS